MRSLSWGTGVAIAALFGAVTLAQEHITMPLGSTRSIVLRKPAATVIVANEGVVRAEPTGGSNTALRLTAEGKGVTTLTVQDASGAVFLSSVVTVGSPERIITIISKMDRNNEKQKGIETTSKQLNLHDQYTYRCDDGRCVQFNPPNRPLDRDDPIITPGQQPQD